MLPAGDYSVRFDADQNWKVWLPPTFDAARADRIRLAPDTDTTITYRLPRPAALDVKVAGSWQALGLDPPKVEFFTSDSVGYGGERVSADGSYHADVYAPISVRLCVRIGSTGTVERWAGAWAFADARSFTLAPGDPPREILYEEGAISCAVEGPGDQADADVDCLLFDETGESELAGPIYTNSGPVTLANLAPGRYLLRVEHLAHYPIWAPQWYDQSTSLAEATPIVVPSGGVVVPITVRLFEGGRIRGKVHWSDGAPYMGWMCVRLNGVTDEHAGFARPTTGAFEIQGLADGEYFVGVPRVTRTLWHPGTWNLSAASVIRVENHGTVEGIDLWIPR
jgi:hypothetical protein